MGCYTDLIIVVLKFRLVYLQKVSATIDFDKRKIKTPPLLVIFTNLVIFQNRDLLSNLNFFKSKAHLLLHHFYVLPNFDTDISMLPKRGGRLW